MSSTWKRLGIWERFLLVLTLVAYPLPVAQADPSADAASFPCAAMDSLPMLTLRNNALTVQIAPSIGRIYGLIPAGGQNLLWREEPDHILLTQRKQQYINWGGDKVWPTLQQLWPRQRHGAKTWPPLPPIDGGEWQVLSQSERTIVMQSQLSDDLGVQVTRSITLHATAPCLTIDNTIVRIKANPLPVMIWSVTQIHRPQMALLDVASDRPAGELPVLNLIAPKGDPNAGLTILPKAVQCVPLLPASSAYYKRGTFGRWIAAIGPHHILLQTTTYDSDACYPDRSNIQNFCDPNYMELETLSPCVYLQPGQSLTNTVIWKVLTRPPLSGPPLVDWLSEQGKARDAGG